MSLCRHYVRELRRSVLVETPELEKQGSKRSSYVLDHYDLNEVSGPSANREKIKDANLSAYLRQENGGVRAVHSAHSSLGSQQSGLQSNGGDRPYNNNNGRPPRASLMSNNMNRTNSGSPAHTVARADLRASAEKILYTFLLPGSEREIILPQNLLNDIIASIEEDGRDDPEVFDAAKDYTFQAMERDAFPGFLRSKALGNLVPPSSFLRLCLGLLGMFGGFWAGFACIFLNKPKHIRCWVGTTFSPCPARPWKWLTTSLQLILPFTIGVYCLSSQQYRIDPVLALAGLSEYTFMNWSRIREPFVRQLLNKRALMVLFITVLIGVCLTVLFIFVPGKRL